MTQECSDDSSESDHDHSLLCIFGLHKWKRKTGVLCCLPTVLEKRYKCIRCGKSKVIFEREERPYRLSAERY